jgi:hypothetical protein
MRQTKKHTFPPESLKKRAHSSKLGIDERTLGKWILKENKSEYMALIHLDFDKD